MQNHMIFNSHLIDGSDCVSSRASWPSAEGGELNVEGVEYSITTYDRQGTYGADRDHLRRQFHSVRSGRSYR